MVSDRNFPDVSFRGIYESDDLQESINQNSAPVIFNEQSASVLSRPNFKLEEHDVPTPFNFVVKVYVSKSSAKTPIVTFHDIGTNHNSFLGFFNYREMRVLMKHFTVYHICAPGHQDHAMTINLNTSYGEEHNTLLNRNSSASEFEMSDQSRNRRSNSIANASSSGNPSTLGNLGRYPTLDELATVVKSVVAHFGITYFIGFGMGAGSNVLCRYTIKNQDNVRALFLINPDAGVHGYYEWFKLRWFDLPAMRKGSSPITDNILNFLEAHWFGYGMNMNVELSQYYEQIAREINCSNLAGFIDSWLSRTDLGLIRTLGPTSYRAEMKTSSIQTDVCLVTGALSTDLSRTLANMNGRMDPEKTQYLILEDCNGMLMEERPDKLTMNFLYFLRNIGLFINMQPDKLLEEAEKLQNEEHNNSIANSEEEKEDKSLTDHALLVPELSNRSQLLNNSFSSNGEICASEIL